MNPTAADTLGKRMINTWRGGPPLTEWVEVLTRLDEGQAGTAFVRLRGESENAPSIARFLSVYKQLRTRSAQAPCETCNGDAWITAPPFTRNGHEYRAAEPCPTCNAGAKP